MAPPPTLDAMLPLPSRPDADDSHKQPDSDDDDMDGLDHHHRHQEVLRPRDRPAALAAARRLADGHVFIPPTARRRHVAHRSADIPSPVSDRSDDALSFGRFGGWADDYGGSPYSTLRVRFLFFFLAPFPETRQGDDKHIVQPGGATLCERASELAPFHN